MIMIMIQIGWGVTATSYMARMNGCSEHLFSAGQRLNMYLISRGTSVFVRTVIQEQVLTRIVNAAISGKVRKGLGG